MDGFRWPKYDIPCECLGSLHTSDLNAAFRADLGLMDELGEEGEQMLAQVDRLVAALPDSAMTKAQFAMLVSGTSQYITEGVDWYQVFGEAMQRIPQCQNDPWAEHELHLLPEMSATRTRLDWRTQEWSTDTVTVKIDETDSFAEGEQPCACSKPPPVHTGSSGPPPVHVSSSDE